MIWWQAAIELQALTNSQAVPVHTGWRSARTKTNIMVTPSAWQGGDLHKQSTAWRSTKLDVPGRYYLQRRRMFTLEYQLRQQRLPDWMDYGTEVTSALAQTTSCTSPSLSLSFCMDVNVDIAQWRRDEYRHSFRCPRRLLRICYKDHQTNDARWVPG